MFRNLYRDFLKESYERPHIEGINCAYTEFIEIAKLWTLVSEMLYKAGDTHDVYFIKLASELLVELSNKEKKSYGKITGNLRSSSSDTIWPSPVLSCLSVRSN